MVTNMMSLTKAKIIIVSKAFMKSHDVDVDKDRTKVKWKADVKNDDDYDAAAADSCGGY